MSTKTVKTIREPLKKPRPLKSATTIEHSKDTKDSLNSKARADLLAELEVLNFRISNFQCDLEEVVNADISLMCSLLKKHGEELDNHHKDILDRYFCTFRNICREDRLDVLSRLKLLEIIEMRAMHWQMNENRANYYSSKYSQLEESIERLNITGSVSPNAILNTQNQNFTNALSLAPGEYLRSSGKFSRPTKIAGKNYYKDEIVIRNCDSGKVMGIKGRRVHMIEELSDTVISFQRVNAGARDRLVQITGPHEEAISHAKFLVEDTIKRNVSPVRDNMNISELAVDNKDHIDYGTTYFDRNNQSTAKRHLTHSYSMSDASSREFCIPVQVGHDVIMLSGAKSDLLKKAKLILTEYFESLEKDSSPLFSTIPTHSAISNQRFNLKKQASLKDNMPCSFSSLEHEFSRHSSPMSSSSDDILPDRENSDLEPVISLMSTPIPPPSYSCRHDYSRQFLLECARLPLSKKCPPEYEDIKSKFPEVIPQSPVIFDPTHYLETENM